MTDSCSVSLPPPSQKASTPPNSPPTIFTRTLSPGRASWLRIRLSYHSSVVNVPTLLLTLHSSPSTPMLTHPRFLIDSSPTTLRFRLSRLLLSQGQVCTLPYHFSLVKSLSRRLLLSSTLPPPSLTQPSFYSTYPFYSAYSTYSLLYYLLLFTLLLYYLLPTTLYFATLLLPYFSTLLLSFTLLLFCASPAAQSPARRVIATSPVPTYPSGTKRNATLSLYHSSNLTHLKPQ